MKFVHQNICGLEANFDHLQGFIELHKEIDIISLSETHLRTDNDCKRLKLEGYKFLGNCRKNGAGGGVCIYIKENIVFKKRSDFNKSSLENLWIEISIKNAKPIIFGCCYRPPETSNYLPKEYDVFFNESVKDIINEKKEVIVMGDFNVDYHRKNCNKNFKDIMKVNCFKQMITSSTRITEDTSTLIDLLFVNKPSNFPTANVIATSLSDHEIIFCSRKINTHKHPNRTIKCRNYRVYDHHQLQNDANNIDWSPIYGMYDVNRAVDFLQSNLKSLFDKHAPLIESACEVNHVNG